MKSADNRLTIKRRQKGVSTLIAFFIMSTFLVIVFGMNAILVGELKIVGGIGDSVIALYAAETGIERVLWEKALPPSGPYNDVLDLGGSIYQSSYSASVISTSTDPGGCPSDVNFCIQSVGIYKDTRRAIQVEI